MSHIIELTLDGLSCNHCVKRVKESLEQRNDVERAEVSLTLAVVTGSASASALIDTIRRAGYGATVTPKAKPLPTASNPPEAPAADTPLPVASRHDDRDSLQLLISGMSCASCVSRVQNALQTVPGVRQARVNLAERTALVTGHVSAQRLIAAVEKAGYGAEAIEDDKARRERQHQTARTAVRRSCWQAALALAVGIPMMIWGMAGHNMMVTQNNRSQWLAIGVVTLLVMIVAGGHFYRNAWKSVLNRSATMDTLVALGTGAAWLYSISVNLWPAFFPPAARHLYYEASVMIIGLINLGHMLEARARQRSSRALEKLLDLTPPTARVVADGKEKVVPLADVHTGMVLRLATGDRVPVDGHIVQGEGWFDEAMLTGEPMPLSKTRGDLIHAGTVVQDGSVLFTADAVGNRTTLARIIGMVRQAQSSKPQIGRLADRISAVFVPVVVAIALLSAAVWYFWGPTPRMVYALVVATTVLIIACPCALGLATPMSIISGVGRAAEYGVLVRDADALQCACHVDTIIFDKTGTLTKGKPQVVATTLITDASESWALRLAAALEQGSGHPLARAVTEKAGPGVLPEVSAFCTLRGLGVSGQVEGHEVVLGNPALMQQRGIDTQALDADINTQAASGATPVLLAVDGSLTALLSIRDPLREESPPALARLRQAGYRLVMLTGDNPVTARAIAREAGIDDVIAGVLPDGKAEAIRHLQEQGRRVAMVGDGINDAPAIALADVGIAMNSGSDIAVETAAMILMRHSLTGVADGLAIARATLRNMKQNLLGAFVYNALGIPIAAGVLYPLTGTLLNPVVAGAAMALSSITVVSNANRLLRYRPRA